MFQTTKQVLGASQETSERTKSLYSHQAAGASFPSCGRLAGASSQQPSPEESSRSQAEGGQAPERPGPRSSRDRVMWTWRAEGRDGTFHWVEEERTAHWAVLGASRLAPPGHWAFLIVSTGVDGQCHDI